MSAHEVLVDSITDALCQRARLDELPPAEQERLRSLIREQALSVVPGIKAWLASDELILAVVEEFSEQGLDDDRALGMSFHLLSRINKEASE